MSGFELDWDALHTSAIFDAMAKRPFVVEAAPGAAASSTDIPPVVATKSVKQQLREAAAHKQASLA